MAHGEALRVLDEDPAVVDGIKSDYRKLELTVSERAVLDYAVKLTATPWLVGEEDIRELRAHDFDDRDILDIIHVICLYNFNDRLADATGIKGHDFLE